MPYSHWTGMVFAIVVIAVGTAWHQKHMNHSPTPWSEAVSRAKRLLRRETSHETDDEISPEDGGIEEYEWGYIDRSEGTTRIELNEPAGAPDPEELDDLERWVLNQQRAGTGSEDIARGAWEEFGWSRATAYRTMRDLKERGYR